TTHDLHPLSLRDALPIWAHRLDGTIAPYRYGQRILERLAGFLVETPEDVVDRPAAGIIDLPAREFLRNRVDVFDVAVRIGGDDRSEEHTSELQSRENLVC